MGDKVIKLSRSYEALGKTFDQLTLREPTGADFWHVGQISEWQRLGEEVAAQITYHDKVHEYATRLARGPEGTTAEAVLGVLSLADSLKVWGGVRDFFIEALRSNTPGMS